MVNKCKKIWSNWNLNKKILISFIVVILIGITASYFMFLKVTRNRTLRQLCETKVLLLKNISDKETYILDNILNIMNMFLTDMDIQKFIKMKEGTDEYSKLQQSQLIKDKLIEQRGVFSNIDYSLSLIGFLEDAYVSNSSAYTKETNKQRMEEYRRVYPNKGYQLIWTHGGSYGEKGTITAISYIPDMRNGEPIGMLILDIPEVVFRQVYQEYVTEQENIFLMNEEGKVISSFETEAIGENYKETELYEDIMGYKEGYFYDVKEKEMVIFVKNPTGKTYIVDTVSYAKLIEPYKNVSRSLPVVFAMVSVICAVVSHQISKSIARPVQNLAEEIHVYCAENNHSDLRYKNGDEISYLEQEYHSMIQRLERMIEQIYAEQELKRKYEIEALKGQIQPHFLYNTLTSIRYLNLTEQKSEVDKALAALINILAVYFKDKSPWESIEQEMNFLKNYCFIQQVRYGNNFEAVIEYEEEITDMLLPKMLLQPIVENAIFHGVSDREEGGLIEIISGKKSGKIEIVVRDNGVGIEKTKEQGKAESHGVGMRNVQERMRLIYGEGASVTIESEADKGTVVTFMLPFITESD
ncbi:cache domain-containing sensor histidine kinase [Parablautia intestinalis]|nr:sensor histidine kinase [Parablautia intestinalis]